MMILTAKVDFKKIMVVLLAIAAVLLALVLFLGQGDSAATTTAAVSENDGRIKFLQDFGWDVTPAPKESSQVRIPEESGEMFRRYNALQKGQGYDLSKYSGKKVMRYVYEINNFPGAQEPVYATLLIYKNKVIGGDVTDTSAHGKIRSFQMPVTTAPTTPTTAPTTAPATAPTTAPATTPTQPAQTGSDM